MCSCLACCVGSALCCAGRACCSCLCGMCSACGLNKRSFARVGYVFFNVFWMAFSFILLFTAKDVLEWTKDYVDCPSESGSGSACMGQSALFRMSFVLGMFHIFIFLSILPRGGWSAAWHDGFWGFKSLLVFVLFIIMLFIPNSFFIGWANFSRVASIFFLLYQALVMLIVAYGINDALVSSYNQDSSKGFAILLIIITVVIYILSILFLIYQYIWFGDCDGNVAIITITLIMAVIFFVLVILKTREDASILTTAIVFLYCLFLSWAAMASRPTTECNPFLDSSSNFTFQVLFGFLITIITLIVAAASTTDSGSGTEGKAGGIAKKVNTPLAEDAND